MSKKIITKIHRFKIVFSIVLLDQISKYFAYSFLSNKNIILIPHLIQLNLVKNTGAAFSILSNSSFFLSFISLLVSLLLLIWISRKKNDRKWQVIAFSFLLGGAMGNGIDRWRLGYVYDFIELIPIKFPIFNIADIAINIAIICLIIDAFHKKNTN